MRVLGSTTHGTEPRQIRDYYATDPQALEDFLNTFYQDGHSLENVWEPSCGEGALVEPLMSRGVQVTSSDIYPYGYGEVLDFLTTNQEWRGDILTNPPYKIAKQFVTHGLSLIPSGRYLILLLRLQFLESSTRHHLFKKSPPRFIYVHSRRIKIFKDNDREKYNKPQPLCYAWFVWEKDFQGEPILRWIP